MEGRRGVSKPLSDAWVEDYFALADGGDFPRCSYCGEKKWWDDDNKVWACPEGCDERSDV